MNAFIIIFVALFALIIFIIRGKEGWYPTGTYVNSPSRYGVYPMRTNMNNWWGGNYYNRLNWRPWGYNNPGYYRRGPVLANAGSNPGAPIPRGNPVPLNTIRWGGMFGPMLTSIKSPKDYYLGQWVTAGTAYTDNPNDFTNVTVQQLNLDPGRDMFSYRVVTKDGQVIPINLRQNHNRLEDGDRFQIQGMEGKGDFVFNEADKYAYVYT